MANPFSVVDLKKGSKVHVLQLLVTGGEHLRKLTAFGIMPGVEIEILQTSPAYVLKIGYTQIALDYQIAKNIIVTK
jgi:ferrous iron transport protein A